MIKFNVRNRHTKKTQFTAELDCDKDTHPSLQLGRAIIWGVNNGANLRDADLRDADLWNADLRGANLRGVDLRNADLRDADLRNTDLRDANLSYADLKYVDLRDANLSYADLKYVNLRDANLKGATYGDNVPMQTAPTSMFAPPYNVLIFDQHMRIGCELHSFDEWFNFTDKQILEMDSKRALEFWKIWRTPLLAVTKTRDVGIIKGE